MAVQTRKMTASEFLALPESNRHHELINGEETRITSHTRKHQLMGGNVLLLVDRLIPHGEILPGPIDVYLDDENVVQPDVLWIAEGSACTWAEGQKYLHGAPDLVVEIFSPGTIRADRRDKFRLYERFGVREYWMVDPDEKLLEIWQGQDGRFTLIEVAGPGDPCKSPLLGEIDLKAIFPDS